MLVNIPEREYHRLRLNVPQSIWDLLRTHPGQLLAGGFLRDLLYGRTPRDIDIFGPAKTSPVLGHPARIINNTAILEIPGVPYPVQWIRNEEGPQALVNSFDFTVNQIIAYANPGREFIKWEPTAPEGRRFDGVLRLTPGAILKLQQPDKATHFWQRFIYFVQKGYGFAPETPAQILAAFFENHPALFAKEVLELFGHSLAERTPQDPSTYTNEPLVTLTSVDQLPSFRSYTEITNESNRPELAINPTPPASFTIHDIQQGPILGASNPQWTPTAPGTTIGGNPSTATLHNPPPGQYVGPIMDWQTAPPQPRSRHRDFIQQALRESGLLDTLDTEPRRVSTARSLRQNNPPGIQDPERPGGTLSWYIDPADTEPPERVEDILRSETDPTPEPSTDRD